MPANDNLTPRERLAKIVAEETDDGRRVVRFLVQVAEGQLDSDDFKGCHRMDAAKELVKIGLTEFEDYVRANSAPRKPRAGTTRPEADLSPELREARERLAAYARELTQDGRTVIKLYAEIMDGLKNDEGFKPHHRIAAARELIKHGFDHDCPRPAPEAEESTANNSELKTNNSETDEPVDYLAIVKRVVEEVGPQEEDQEEINDGHKPDTSMWDYIHSLPQPEITEEHARIGAARFHAAIERQKLWKQSNIKLPDKKDYPKNDDG